MWILKYLCKGMEVETKRVGSTAPDMVLNNPQESLCDSKVKNLEKQTGYRKAPKSNGLVRRLNMEEGLGDTLSIAKDATLIKDAQLDIGKLDILVCGTCHGSFHFVEEFNVHKSGNCSETTIAKLCDSEDKALAWAFCLWKNKELKLQPSTEKAPNMWSVYQKWTKLPQETRDLWSICGQNLLSLNKIRAAKMQEVKFKVKREEDKDPTLLNDMHEDKDDKNSAIKTEHPKSFKSNNLTNIKKDSKMDTDELNEYVVESILGKRFNPNKKIWEYKVKWENFDESQCSWEPTEHLAGCKSLIQKFEEKIKQDKKDQLALKAKTKVDAKTDDESSDHISGRRPQRSSKQKALSQVKRWLGEGSDNEDGNKRSLDDDDDSDQSFEKKMRLEEESDESFDDEDDDKRTNLKRNGLAGKKIPHNVLIPDAQGIVRINQKQLPSLSSGVYIMSKTAGIIKLDSQTSKIAASGGQAVVKVAPRIGQTHIRIVKKDGGTTNKVIQMSPKPRLPGSLNTPRMGQKVTKIVRPMSSTPRVKVENEEKDMTTVKEELKHHGDEDSDGGLPELEFPSEILPPEPEEPQSDFTLDPTTGKIAGMDYPDPDPEREISTEDNKENSENALDNIVKLAAADITEADLKSDEPMETDVSQHGETIAQQQLNLNRMEQKKAEIMQREEIRMKKDNVPTSKTQHKFMITTNFKNSNILERTLQTPKGSSKAQQSLTRQVYAAKSPQRILNSAMTPKLTSPMNPMVRTVVRSAYSSKPKQMLGKQRVYMAPSSKFNEGIIKQSSFKTFPNKRVGNIGSTTIYKRSPQQNRFPASPKVVQRTNVVRRSTPNVVRTVVQRPPKPVISMPSLMDDDVPAQSISDSMQLMQKVEVMPENVDAATNAVAAGAVTTEADLSTFSLNDGEAPIFITGDDGTVYQVAGQNEQGQTILITQGPDGQQQCLLVTSENAAPEDAPQEDGTQQLVSAVEGEEVTVQQPEAIEAEVATEEESQDPREPLSVKTDETPDQVVAQVVRAEPPSPGGTHKVVVMLPDGNLMITQVSPEEYASLELDK